MQFIKEWGLGIDGTVRETLKRQSWGEGGGESLGGGSAYSGLASKSPVIEHNRLDDVFTPVVFRQLDILPD